MTKDSFSKLQISHWSDSSTTSRILSWQFHKLNKLTRPLNPVLPITVATYEKFSSSSVTTCKLLLNNNGRRKLGLCFECEFFEYELFSRVGVDITPVGIPVELSLKPESSSLLYTVSYSAEVTPAIADLAYIYVYVRSGVYNK